MSLFKKKYSLDKIFLALSANYLSAFAWGLFAPIFALIVVDRGGTASDVGLIWGGYTLLTGLLMITIGKLEDQHKMTKRLLVAGTVLQALASLVLFIETTLFGLILAQAIFGFGFGAGVPALRKLYGKFLDKGKEATEWAFMDGGNMLIMSFAALAGGFIYEFSNADVLYMIMTVVFGLSALLFGLVVKQVHKEL